MKPEIFWLYRNNGAYHRSIKKPKVFYNWNDDPVRFLARNYSVACSYTYNQIAPKQLHVGHYQAKHWRVITDNNGDVHFELLEWIWIDRKES